MSSLMSGVAGFMERFGRRDNLASLSEDIHHQAESQEWDAEDNSEESITLIDPNPSGIAYTTGSGSYVSIDPTLYNQNVNVSSYPMYSWTDGNLQLASDPSCYTFALANGREITVRIIENNSALEIEYDNSVMEPISDIGKITLRNSFDEENNAGQNIRTHEEPIEDNTHSSENLLLTGTSGEITFTAHYQQ